MGVASSSIVSAGKCFCDVSKEGLCCYLVDYKSHTGDFKSNVETLKELKKGIRDREAEEEKRYARRELRADVDQWVNRAVPGLELECDSIIGEVDKYNEKSCAGKWCCPGLWSRFWLSRKASKRDARVKDVIVRGGFGGDIFRGEERRRGVGGVHFQAFESRAALLGEIKKALEGEGAGAVGVHGMGGVGKTVMARTAVEHAVKEANGAVCFAVEATVSQTVDVKGIQSQIAEKLEIDLSGLVTEEGRAERLRRVMSGSNRELIVVLDDVWEVLDLWKVGIPEPGSCKVKVLITSRDKSICDGMGCRATFHLKPLTEDESLSILKEAAGLAFGSQEFEAAGREVARICGGLPIALVVVGRALKDEGRAGWEEAAERLRGRPGIDDDRLAKCVRLSVGYLSRKAEREYFRACCLFPEDCSIGKEELARYGMGLGWFEEVNTMDEARKEADAISKRLISSGLLLDGNKKGYVKMHDVIRDVAIRMSMKSDRPESGEPIYIRHAGRELRLWPDGHELGSSEPIYMVQAGRALKTWPRREDYNRYTAISVMSNNIQSLPGSLDSAALKVLLLQENNNLKEIPKNFFVGVTSLRVLSMTNIGASSLPRSIKFLSNLRALFLDYCDAKNVSVVGSLKKLEILSLKRCPIEAVPEQMGGLANLRILDLAFSNEIESFPRAVISGLTSLEELGLQGSFANWEEEGANACFADLIDLPCLTSLKVDMRDYKCMPSNLRASPNWNEFHICISGVEQTRKETALMSTLATDSRRLLLDISMSELPNWFIDVVSSKAEWLMFSECVGLNLVEEYDRGRLSGLKSLIVELCDNPNPLMSFVDSNRSNPVFENLQELRVHRIGEQKEICVGELLEGSLEKLKFLDVQHCTDIQKILLPSNMIKRLKNLEKLNVVSATGVVEVFGFEGLQDGSFFLEALEAMRLDSMFRLTSLYKGSKTFVRFNKLKCVIVTNCKALTYLFSESVARGLTNLEDLWIEGCPKMEKIIHWRKGIPTQKITLPELKTLTLQNLAQCDFCKGSATLECPLLEHVYVKNCPLLERVVNESSGFTDLNYSMLCNSNTVRNDEQHMELLKKRYKHLFE